MLHLPGPCADNNTSSEHSASLLALDRMSKVVLHHMQDY